MPPLPILELQDIIRSMALLAQFRLIRKTNSFGPSDT